MSESFLTRRYSRAGSAGLPPGIADVTIGASEVELLGIAAPQAADVELVGMRALPVEGRPNHVMKLTDTAIAGYQKTTPYGRIDIDERHTDLHGKRWVELQRTTMPLAVVNNKPAA